jgi:hypothetical protein
VYDRSISILEKGIKDAKVGRSDKLDALKRLGAWMRDADATS